MSDLRTKEGLARTQVSKPSLEQLRASFTGLENGMRQDLPRFLEEVAARIRAKFGDIDFSYSGYTLGVFYGDLPESAGKRSIFDRISNKEIWVTDRPREIFQGDRGFFTVTSTLALNDIAEGRPLVPASFVGNLSHRGPALDLQYGLLSATGISDIAQNFVFMGNGNVDADQVLIEDRIGQVAPQEWLKFLELLGLEMRIERDQIKLNWREDPQLIVGNIEAIMESLSIITGIREGWYDLIKQRLGQTGNAPLGADTYLFNVFYKFSEDIKQKVKQAISTYQTLSRGFSRTTLDDLIAYLHPPSRAVVLEIDPDLLFAGIANGKASVFLPDRPPHSIVSAPFVPATAVRSVYTVTDIEPDTKLKLAQRGIDVKDIRTLDKDLWLGGKTFDPSNLSVLPPANDALCGLRYDAKSTTQAVWRDHLWNQRMSPLLPGQISDWNAGIDVFGLFGAEFAAGFARNAEKALDLEQLNMAVRGIDLPGLWNPR